MKKTVAKTETNAAGRTYVGRGISMPGELWERIDRYVHEAYPRFANVSHFLQVAAYSAMKTEAAQNEPSKTNSGRDR